MMTEPPPKSSSGDEICSVCGKPKNDHDPKQMLKCSKQLVEQGLMRYCGVCGLTKPSDGLHDRCSKCGEKYTFSNE